MTRARELFERPREGGQSPGLRIPPKESSYKQLTVVGTVRVLAHWPNLLSRYQQLQSQNWIRFLIYAARYPPVQFSNVRKMDQRQNACLTLTVCSNY